MFYCIVFSYVALVVCFLLIIIFNVIIDTVLTPSKLSRTVTPKKGQNKISDETMIYYFILSRFNKHYHDFDFGYSNKGKKEYKRYIYCKAISYFLIIGTVTASTYLMLKSR